MNRGLELGRKYSRTHHDLKSCKEWTVVSINRVTMKAKLQAENGDTVEVPIAPAYMLVEEFDGEWS